jgi:sensor histidine kinase YesM
MDQQQFIFSDERKYRLRRHLFFWLCWWIFFGILYSYTAKVSLLPNFKRLPFAMLDALVFLIPHMFLSYSLMYYVIPKFVFIGRYLKAGILVLFFFLVTACLSAVIGIYVLPVMRFAIFGEGYDYRYNPKFLLALLAGLRGAITIGGLAAAIKLMKHWYIKEQRNLQLQKENTEAGLRLLKAQIHPHFLFNTLNNIYSFTQNTSAEASGMITRLSSLLRYTLYEGNQPLVSLQKELQMVQDYIEIEKIRYGNQMELHIDLPERTTNYYIAPLLLLPLVENCFKHGTSQMLEQPWVHLQATIVNDQLHVKLLNGKVNEETADEPVSGIGIRNVKERLSLLYPGKHELHITSEEEVFIVNLKIVLAVKKEALIKKEQPVYA